MRFLIDECLSHSYVDALAVRGYPDAIHPIHVGLRGARDDTILARAIIDDRVIVTANAADYRKLLAATTIHPGAIIVEALDRDAAWRQLMIALAFIELQSNPDGYMVNRVLEISARDGLRPYELPSPA